MMDSIYCFYIGAWLNGGWSG